MNDYTRKRNISNNREKNMNVNSNKDKVISTKKKKSDEKFKNTLIIALIIISLLQAIYIVFYTLNLKENSVKKSFLTFYINAQKDVSTYLIETKLNTYDAYNYSQIFVFQVLLFSL